jgi:hypothetical protein
LQNPQDLQLKFLYSLCASPAGSANIGIAYANRSVVCLKMGYYKTALANIRLARDNNYPASQLEKLAKREQRCLEKIQAVSSKEDSFQKHKAAKEDLFMQKLPANEKYPFYIADCLTLDKSEEFGREVRTKIDLKVGTIVASEKHSAATFMPEVSYRRCEFCKSVNMLNLIPCDSCIRVMYCSEKCRQDDFESHHNLTCGIDCGIHLMGHSISKLFAMGLNCFQNPTEFAEFLKTTEDSDETAWDMDFTGLDQKEINKKLLQSVNSYKVKKPPMPEENFLYHFKHLVWFTATFLNFSKFKDILATEELKNMFRNFAFQQFRVKNKFYYRIQRVHPADFGVDLQFFVNFFNHSCAPNIKAYYDDTQVHYMVLRPIKKGEQLFMAGKNFSQFSVAERREMFPNLFGFICECVACKNPRKYPVLTSLPIKNRQAYQKYDRMLASRFTLDLAVENWRPICNYLEENDGNYPALENFVLYSLIEQFIQVFCKFDDFSKFFCCYQ